MSGDSFEVNIEGPDYPVIIRKSAALGDINPIFSTPTPPPPPPRLTPVTIATPAINDAAPGNPTGLPANTFNVSNEVFYNLSDGNDNVLVSSVPIFPISPRIRPPILALSGNDNIIGTNGYDTVNGMLEPIQLKERQAGTVWWGVNSPINLTAVMKTIPCQATMTTIRSLEEMAMTFFGVVKKMMS